MTSEIQNPKSGIRPLPVPVGYGYGTHLPALAHYVLRTTGPVLELGAGRFSTPALHAWCRPASGTERPLVTAEDTEYWRAAMAQFATPWHILVEGFDGALHRWPHWDVVLIDHAKDRRQADLMALADRAKYLICHDANCPKVYGYDFSSFKFHRHWDELSPTTMVVSNEVQP